MKIKTRLVLGFIACGVIGKLALLMCWDVVIYIRAVRSIRSNLQAARDSPVVVGLALFLLHECPLAGSLALIGQYIHEVGTLRAGRTSKQRSPRSSGRPCGSAVVTMT